MANCKICVCGEKITFDRASAPDECPYCGRRLINYATFDESDPQVAILLKNNSDSSDEECDEHLEKECEQKETKAGFVLVSDCNEEIFIPDEGGIIGRAEIGAEILAKYPSVSKQHIKIYPSFGNRLIVEDISKYGTFLNGEKLEKNLPKSVAVKDKLTLCNVDFTLCEKIL